MKIYGDFTDFINLSPYFKDFFSQMMGLIVICFWPPHKCVHLTADACIQRKIGSYLFFCTSRFWCFSKVSDMFHFS